MDIEIRPVAPEDAEGVEAVRSAGWRASYRGLVDDAYLDTYYGDAERRRALIVEAGPELVQLVGIDSTGQVVAWSGGGPSRDDDAAGTDIQAVYSCYVDPEQWGQGIGAAIFTQVMEALARRGPSTTLWVLTGNARARRFYESHGFSADGAEMPAPFPGEPMELRYARANR